MMAIAIESLLYIIYDNRCTSQYCFCCPYTEKSQDIHNERHFEQNELKQPFIERENPFVQNFMYENY